MLQAKLIAFIDALMVLFEDKNRVLYKHLIHHHHHVKNVMSEDDLWNLCHDFLTESVRERIERHDPHFVSAARFASGWSFTELETDIDLIWESCTSENKVIIWKWVDSIMRVIDSQ